MHNEGNPYRSCFPTAQRVKAIYEIYAAKLHATVACFFLLLQSMSDFHSDTMSTTHVS